MASGNSAPSPSISGIIIKNKKSVRYTAKYLQQPVVEYYNESECSTYFDVCNVGLQTRPRPCRLLKFMNFISIQLTTFNVIEAQQVYIHYICFILLEV